MIRPIGAAVLALLAAASLAPAQADPAVTGRWAADAAGCALFSGELSPLIVTDSAVRWHDDACRIARMYKTGDTVHIQALCWSFAGERSIPVSLRPHGGLLAVTWDRTRRGDLRRCR